MSRILCLCGEALSNCSDMNEVEGIIAPNYKADFECSVVGIRRDWYEVPINDARDVWECPECGRLIVQERLGDNHFKYYKPEDGKPGHLFAHENNKEGERE